ncbi:hypothetical protein [Psychrobacter phenylpyruvicus]|uniref:Uncharacterized protein n=1 Tax=Psychrobacter phenylpyruvicus TaxID=29432 RepID=A0A379LNK3_9GAMM|nr:hypothetical protein [Psychrobacter phenylpyruvicus]SUD91344.1 Uncharacterised protein [Psychrobacter phenylpyruvicus]
MASLQLYFDPTLTSRQRLLCRMFWKKCEIEEFDDIAKQIHYLQSWFELPDASEVLAILNYCYVYDSRYQCQVCRQLRRVTSPLQLKQTIETPWRCKSCLLLTA